ncbi:uncharacterized protein LOC124439006 isoform X1 [Xenia sp. Carnegie-2017]|uniref:uncharacterized protein LOC124439006 isoform X1 n=1 Tax=Xenia sp. Carnegie-2017 TaxID=2897299 RepID=UPI001F03724B|nr:uncharacterized protein LOC124439006 isoform X1 [Xenia sp. Carnegie-2017]
MSLVAIVLSDFQKSADDELSVKEHELLNVVNRNDENWWKVNNRHGKTGLVPVNNLAAPIHNEAIKIISRGKTFDRYDSEYEDALSVYKGQEVAIFDKSDDDWWYVGFRGQIGYLPKVIIAEFEPLEKNDKRDLQKFAFQVIVPSRALCKEGADVLVTFQKPLPNRGQYFVNFKGNQSDFTVLGEFLNDFTLKITTPICSEAEKTKVTINHKQFGLPQQLIAEGIDFEFESNTDVTYRLLKTEDAPLDIVHNLLEIFNPKYEDLSDSDIDRVYDYATVRSWKIMEDCYNKYIINNYQYTFMDIREQKDEGDCDVSETLSIDDESMDRDLKRMTEKEVILALLAKCVKTKRVTQEQAQQIAETLYFKANDFEPVYEAIKYEGPGYVDNSKNGDNADENSSEEEVVFPEWKKCFLDDDYNIRDEVHNKLKEILWITGAYGIVHKDKNKKMPYEHLYVTVDNKENKSEDILRNEMDEKFGLETSKFIEFRYKQPKKRKFLFSSNLRAKDGILPINGDIQIQNSTSSRNNHISHMNDISCGSLTMFCCKKEMYYALTCAHVACVTDQLSVSKAFGQENEVSIIIDNVNARNENDGNRYFYQLPNSDEKRQLGGFPCNTVSTFDSESDMMYIPIGKKEDFQHLGGDDMENFSLDLKETNKELYKTANSNKGFVEVRTSNHITGVISDRNFSCIDGNLKPIFKNAVMVKSMDSFLQNGDSGSLVYFKDRENNWQPFAYAVCEIVDDDDGDDDIETTEKHFLCLKLDKTLKMLDLKDCKFFKKNCLCSLSREELSS